MPAPARWTAASMPASPAASIVPALGSQRTVPGPPPSPRTTGTTSCPAAVNAPVSAVPMRPVDPVMATRTRPSVHEDGYGRHDGVGPVQQPGLEGQRRLVVEELRRPRRDELRDDDRDH